MEVSRKLPMDLPPTSTTPTTAPLASGYGAVEGSSATYLLVSLGVSHFIYLFQNVNPF